jgi:hypothetical protein
MFGKIRAVAFFVEYSAEELRVNVAVGQPWFGTFSDDAADFGSMEELKVVAFIGIVRAIKEVGLFLTIGRFGDAYRPFI